MNQHTFDISEHKYNQLVTDVKKYNKIATRLDCDHISIEVTDTYKSFDPLAKMANTTDLTWSFPQIPYYKGTISNIDITFDNYDFLGSIHRISNKHASSSAHYTMQYTETELPTRYTVTEPFCEHCNTKRYRNVTYIVQNRDTKEICQVGTSCFKDYFNVDALNIIKLLKVVDRVSDFDNYEEKTRKRKINPRDQLFSAMDIIKLSHSIIRLYGYHKQNNTTDDIPTSEILTELCLEPTSARSKVWFKELEENKNNYLDEAAANAAAKWVLSENGVHTNYTSTIKQLLKNEFVTSHRFAVLCSLVESHKKSIQKDDEYKKTYSNVYFGEIGNTYSLGMKCIDKREIGNYYRDVSSYLIKLIDSEHNVFVWFHKTGHGIEIGKTKKFNFKIKAHSSFDNKCQTQIIWVKEIKEYDDEFKHCKSYQYNQKLDRLV